MNFNTIPHLIKYFVLGLFLVFSSCADSSSSADKAVASAGDKAMKDKGATAQAKKEHPSDVISFYEHFKLILGDGVNAGVPTNFSNKDFFYTAKDGKGDWVVYKTPNAGDTHGTSNNTRTELGQVKK